MNRRIFVSVGLGGLLLAGCGRGVSSEPQDPDPAELSPGSAAVENPSYGYFAGGCFWGVEHFLEDYPEATVTPEASLALAKYTWPGNVRELRHAMVRAAVLAEGAEIRLEHLPELPPGAHEDAQTGASLASAGQQFFGLPLKEARAEFERLYLERLLQKCAGNVSESARQAGVGRASLHEKINKLGLDPDRYR